VIAALDDRELGHILAGLRLLQRTMRHSADLGDIATDAGKHEPMSPDEIDNLCEHLNTASKTVGEVMRARPSMVVLNDEATWTGIDGVKIVFLPDDPEVFDMHREGHDADQIVSEAVFAPPAGVFDLARLVLDLPADLLETYRLKAGRENAG